MWVIFLRAGAVLPFIAVLGESGPLFEVRWDVKRLEGLLKRVAPCHVGAAQRPGVRRPSGQEFARYAGHGHAQNVAGPSKDAVAVVVGERFDPGAVEEGGGADAVAVGVGEGDAAHGKDTCVVEGLAQEVLKSSQGLLFSEAKKAICRGSGLDWRAGAGARVWSPLPPGLSKESGER